MAGGQKTCGDNDDGCLKNKRKTSGTMTSVLLDSKNDWRSVYSTVDLLTLAIIIWPDTNIYSSQHGTPLSNKHKETFDSVKQKTKGHCVC